MKRILAITFAAAGILVAASSANAAECVGGYRALNDSLVVPCANTSVSGFHMFRRGALREPATTGSIAPMQAETSGQIAYPESASPVRPTAAAAPAEQVAKEATNPGDCRPGGYWMIQSHDNTFPVLCR